MHAAGQMGLGSFVPRRADEEMRRAGVGDAEEDAAPAAQRAARRPQPSMAPEFLSSDEGSESEQEQGNAAQTVIAVANAVHQAADRAGHVRIGDSGPGWLQTF